MRIGFPLIQKYRPGLSGLCLIRKFRQAQLHQKARQTLINLGGTGELEPVRKISILKRKRSVSAPCIQHKEAETMQRANATETKTFQHYRDRLSLSREQLQHVTEEFQEQMQKGLQKEDSGLLMIPTLVDTIPDGLEEGDLFGIEVGGSKLHIVHTRLPKDRHEVDTVQVQETLISEAQRTCSTEKLFAFIADRTIEFSESIGRDLTKAEQTVIVGFCFSFPLRHESIKSAKLLKWTKGYENENGIGQDPAKLLTSAFKARGIQITVEALMNDTVGVLCATRYTAGPDANVSVIMGTGTNACYVENLANIDKFKMKYFARTQEMVVNIEWPGFKSHAFEYLEEDRELDSQSHRPGEQAFEKLTSGLYMGEIARRILLRVAEGEDWPRDEKWMQSRDPSHFSTQDLTYIAQDDSKNLDQVAFALNQFFGKDQKDYSKAVLEQAKEICKLVASRSAQLVAAAIIGILKHIEHHNPPPETRSTSPRNIVAVDGGVFANFRLYRDLLCQSIKEIAGEEFAKKFKLNRTEGGAGFGAACLAAASFKYDKQMGRIPDLKAPLRKFPPRRTSSGSTHSPASHHSGQSPKGLTSGSERQESTAANLAD